MARTYTITTTVPVHFRLTDMPADEHETAWPTMEVTYTYSPARPAYTPRGEYAPIDPPEDAEVEVISAKVIDADGTTLTDSEAGMWATMHVANSDLAFIDFCCNAEDYLHPDPDDARDRERDDRLTERY